MSVIVIVNARSRANRRDPGLAERLATALGDAGAVLTPTSLPDMAAKAQGMASSPPRVVAVHGGDGTLHQTLSALLKAFEGRALPTIAILPGGTMNVVSASLGLRAPAETIVRELAAGARSGRPYDTVRRRCLRIDGRHGFVFGNGFMANFLEEYYTGQRYGAGRALSILARSFGSALLNGPYHHKIFRPFAGRVVVDGQALPYTRLIGIGAGTVREVGLRFKLNHRADDDPDRFAALAIHGPPAALGLDILPVFLGQGTSPRRAWSGLAREVVLEPDPADERGAGPDRTDGDLDGHLYTIDGDLYRHKGPLTIGLGPFIEFFRPANTPGPSPPSPN